MAVIQPTGRLTIRAYTDTVLTSFGLKQPANNSQKNSCCSPSNVTLPQNDCQTYFTCQTIVQAVIYIILCSCPDISKSGSHFRPCSYSSLVKISTEIFAACSLMCVLCVAKCHIIYEKEDYFPIWLKVSSVWLLLQKKRILACRNLLAIEISDTSQRWRVIASF